MKPSSLPPRAGVGFKPEHFAAIDANLQPLGFFEVHAENYMARAARRMRSLRASGRTMRCRSMASACRSGRCSRSTATISTG